ncbi:MAG: NADH-quinone oxidoreductase subunit A [Myxococcota bacterium]
MIEGYVPFALAIAVGVGLAGGIIVLKSLLGPRRPNAAKGEPFECGSEPIGPPRVRIGVKFYQVAILFLVFDLEVAFFYPWAVVFRDLGWYGLHAMLVFFAILLVALFYVWQKGALDWGPRPE